jgi:hypothetical protein
LWKATQNVRTIPHLYFSLKVHTQHSRNWKILNQKSWTKIRKAQRKTASREFVWKIIARALVGGKEEFLEFERFALSQSAQFDIHCLPDRKETL